MMIMTVHSQFSSVQDGIYAPGKAHMRFTPSVRSFPNVASETVLMFVCLMIAFSRPFKEDRLAHLLSMPLSSRRSMMCPFAVQQKQVWQDKSEDGMYMMMMMMMTVHLQCS